MREAVVNAVVHRDYSRSGETVRVFLFPDRVEVRSPGGLPPEISVDDLLSLRPASVSHNPILAGFLRDIPGYMERIGSGIRFMPREMEAQGLPPPEFSEHFNFIVTFRNGGKAVEPEGLHERQLRALEMGQCAHAPPATSNSEKGASTWPQWCPTTRPSSACWAAVTEALIRIDALREAAEAGIGARTIVEATALSLQVSACQSAPAGIAG